jgi:SAM-dependent methyltransferase
MSHITHGVRAVLSYPRIYDLFQRMIGKRNGLSNFSSRYIVAERGNRVIDIGCGSAKWLNFLPVVEYCGFDPNPHYIKSAKNRFRDVPGCTFLCATVDEAVVDTLPKFDIALALGVLHHLDDAAVIRLAKLAKAALKDKGRLILVDPCFVEGQSPIARWMIRLDRGQHVRDVNGYKKLMNTTFGIVNTDIRHDLIRLPYTHLVMECLAE